MNRPAPCNQLHRIERWYDKYSRCWVVQLKDEEGNQVADAIYVHSRKEAESTAESDFVLYQG